MLAKPGNIVGFRLSKADIEKLDRLASKTFRNRADVVRLLIARADLSGQPDVVLDRGVPVPEGADEVVRAG